MNMRLDESYVRGISEVLNSYSLHESARDLVVVGGAALGAYGIQLGRDTDIDIVVSPSLANQLAGDSRWDKDLPPRNTITSRRPISRTHLDSDTAYGITTVEGDLTALEMPIDRIYCQNSNWLIDEAIHENRNSHYLYLFSPLSRILDWKLALAESPDYLGPKAKHVSDARKIAAFIINNNKASSR